MVIFQLIFSAFPAVKRQLRRYKAVLGGLDTPLTRQGLDSIRTKAFHCLGGSVYVFLAEPRQRRDVLKFIVAFQTISDYLDNLCDRFGIHEEAVFRQLHVSMLDSLEPDSREHADYYSLFPCRDDGGYLCMLVDDCRSALAKLPVYPRSREHIRRLTRLYIDLQSYKHRERRSGEEKLAALHEAHRDLAPDLRWWEFAAACGSTLGIFALAAAGWGPDSLFHGYMPWFNGFHILLDYFIDQEEDRCHEDMNLVSYIGEKSAQAERLLWFYGRAKSAAGDLAGSSFHDLVLDGLLALYLSDPKAQSLELAAATRRVMEGADSRARILENTARSLRRLGVI